jgi:hypothetical protein
MVNNIMKKKKNTLQENMSRFKTKNLNEHMLGQLPSEKLIKMKWNPLTESVELGGLSNKISNILPAYDNWKATFVPSKKAIAVMRNKKLMSVITRSPDDENLLVVRVSKDWDSTLGLQKYNPTLLINNLLPNEIDTIDWMKKNFGTAPKLTTPDSDMETNTSDDTTGGGGAADPDFTDGGTGEEIYDQKPSGGFCKRNLDIDWYFDILITGKSYLRQGDCGVAVETAQQHTNEFTTGDFASDGNFGPLKVDGMYGPQTKKYISRVQDFLNLKPDGLFGKKTHDALINAIKSGESMKLDPLQPEKYRKDISKLKVLAPVSTEANAEMKAKALKGKEKRTARRLKKLKLKQGKLKKKMDKLTR